MGHTLVIAECGSCHDNDIDKAYALIEAAKSSGADCCKFQFWSSAERLAEQRKMPDYLPVYKKYQMPREWLDLLKKRCDKAGIEFLSTVYLPEDCCTLAPYQRRVKIANYEAHQIPLKEACYSTFYETIISVRSAFQVGDCHQNVKKLYCVPNYPTEIKDLRLRRYNTYKKEYDGLSDHTIPLLTGALCVARGGTIVERHICVAGTEPNNPDFPHSTLAEKVFCMTNPFEIYVSHIREAEEAMG